VRVLRVTDSNDLSALFTNTSRSWTIFANRLTYCINHLNIRINTFPFILSFPFLLAIRVSKPVGILGQTEASGLNPTDGLRMLLLAARDRASGITNSSTDGVSGGE